MIFSKVLIDALARNPKLKALIDKAVSQFIDGLTRTEPTRNQRLQAISQIVAAMEAPAFADSLESDEYFELLLTIISELAYLKEQPLVLSDFYVSGRYFYFPVPAGSPQVVVGTFPRVEGPSARQIQTPPKQLYRFYALPSASGSLEKLKRYIPELSQSAEPAEWQRALASAAEVKAQDVVPITVVGKARGASHVILVDNQDVFGDSDLRVVLNPATRAKIVRELRDFLARPTF